MAHRNFTDRTGYDWSPSKLDVGCCYGLVAVVAAAVWATPSGQPALVSDHARYAVDGPSGFDQAQGAGR